eukprot:g18301.t1
MNIHLLCLSGGVLVGGIDVHHPVVRGIDVDETSTSSSSSGVVEKRKPTLPKIAAWEDEYSTRNAEASRERQDVPDSAFTGGLGVPGADAETHTPRPMRRATRAARRLRHEKEAAHQHKDKPSREPPSLSPTSTNPSRDRRSKVLDDAEAADYNSTEQYLVVEANGAGFENQPWMSGNRGRGQRVEPTGGDGRNRKPSTHLLQPSGGSYSHVEQQRRSSYASAATGGDAGARLDSGSESFMVRDPAGNDVRNGKDVNRPD